MAFQWTKARALAAVDVAEDELSHVEIAKRAGVSRQALDKWKANPEFQKRVAEHIADLEDAAKRLWISKRRKRLAALNDQLDRIDAVIAARAADETMKGAGHESGILVRTYKPGKLRMVEEYAVDTALLKERRETMKQAAIELGQWAEKRELTGKDGGPIELADVSEAKERLARRLAQLAAREGEAAVSGEPD